jgi:MATE family multidrug resistance protein
MGLAGIGVATSITFTLDLLGNLVLIYFREEIYECLEKLDRQVFTTLWEYIKIGIPTSIIFCFDMWSFAILTYISHYLGINENAAQVILYNLVGLLYAIPLGFNSAACTLVGRNIGRWNVAKAKLYGYQTIFLTIMISIIPSACLAIFPEEILYLFTDDIEVHEAARFGMILSSAGFIADALSGVMIGVVKGVEL